MSDSTPSKRITVKSGDRHGDLVVVREIDRPFGQKHRLVLCLCDCGNEKLVALGNLGKGVNSCGCRRRRHGASILFRHGFFGTRLYGIWAKMKSRCECETHEAYDNYGGRDITVCSEWQSFEIFKDWALENGYSDTLTIERNEVNGNYEPSNCRWIPRPDQAKNTRRTVRLTFNGETMILEDAARKYNIKQSTLWMRLYYRGWSIEKSLTEPVGVRNARV